MMGIDLNDMAAMAMDNGIDKRQLAEVMLQEQYRPQAANDGFVELVNNQLFRFEKSFDGYNAEFDYLIKGYLPAKAFGVVYGASGSFKSFLVLNWAVHVALGKEWNGKRVRQQGVLYIAGEGGIGVPRRVKALADHYNNGEDIDPLYRLGFPVSMLDSGDVTRLIASIRAAEQRDKQKIGLVIIDTLARCFGAGKENDTADANVFIKACDRVKMETGATILVVHHSGKGDQKSARGSTAFRAACDFEYRVERSEGDTPQLVLHGTKSKDEKEPQAELFALEECFLFRDGDGDPINSLVCLDQGREPPEPEASGTKPVALSPSEQALWQAVRSRLAKGESTAVALIRDDLKSQGASIGHFARWLKGCVLKGHLIDRDGALFPAKLEGGEAWRLNEPVATEIG